MLNVSIVYKRFEFLKSGVITLLYFLFHYSEQVTVYINNNQLLVVVSDDSYQSSLENILFSEILNQNCYSWIEKVKI